MLPPVPVPVPVLPPNKLEEVLPPIPVFEVNKLEVGLFVVGLFVLVCPENKLFEVPVVGLLENKLLDMFVG